MKRAAAVLGLTVFVGCQCGSSSSSNTVGGTVTGVNAGGLVLQNDGKDDLTIASDGPFTFATKLSSGSAYAVTVKQHPAGQTCVVTKGTGTMGDGPVSDVTVTCSSLPACTFTNPSTDTTSRFGAEVRTLATGNVVVSDPVVSVGGQPHVGMVHLFSGRDCSHIQTLSGTTAEEAVGLAGIGVLTNGNFVVLSNFGVTSGSGGMAATLVDGSAGLGGNLDASHVLNIGTPTNGLAALGSTPVPCLIGQPALPAATCAGILTNILSFTPGSGPLLAAGSPFGLGLPPLVNEEYSVVPLPNGNFLFVSRGGPVVFADGKTGATNPAINGTVGVIDRGVLTPCAIGIVSGITVFPNSTYLVPPSAPCGVSASGNGNGTGGAAVGSDLVLLANGNLVSAVNTVLSGTTGQVLGSNSVAPGTVTPLSNGNYVVGTGTVVSGTDGHVLGTNAAPSGAVTPLLNGNFVIGRNTVVSGVNGSVLGSNALGAGSITVLSNGNFVVSDPTFSSNAGQVTLVDGTSAAVISTLAGSLSGDRLGSGGATPFTVFTGSVALNGIVPLTNGNFVVVSPSYGGGRGAVTWVNGTTGLQGLVGPGNSLVGAATTDAVGSGIARDEFYGDQPFAGLPAPAAPKPAQANSGFRVVQISGAVPLPNGNYVVMSPAFGGGIGAATWGDGTHGTVGVVSASNSLVGSVAGDHVSGGGARALPSGNYVVMSPLWSNGAAFAAGAVTFGNGAAGSTGVVSATNSLVGSTAGDALSFTGFSFLSGLPTKPALTNATVYQTLFSQGGGSGDSAADLAQFGIDATVTVLYGQLTVLRNGNYVVMSPYFGGEKGAVTLGSGATGVSGTVSSGNSVLGTRAHGYLGQSVQDDVVNNRIVVSGSAERAAAGGIEVVARSAVP